MRKVLYFVGAGVSRAMAKPEQPIPLMWDFLSVISGYLYDDVILTTLCQLENSDPYPYRWNWTRAREVAPQLVGKNANRSPAMRARFADALRTRPTESLEDVMDRVLTGTPKNSAAHEAQDRFLFMMARLFCLIGWNVNFCDLDHFLAHQFAIENTTHTFVSFNYDILLERSIQRVGGKWDVATGYGFRIKHRLDADPDPKPPRGGAYKPGAATALESSMDPTDSLSVLKPHSSLNWIVPDKELDPDGADVILPLSPSGEVRYFCSMENFVDLTLPGNAIPIHVKQSIVPPTSCKNTNRKLLSEVREKERLAILEADGVFVLGWSMPRTDIDQDALLRNAIGDRAKPLDSVTVVNKGSGADYFDHVSRVFGTDTRALRIHNDGMQTFAASLA
jgi:SpoVK/Ycf46/Vps4 family AAA+-type ATPase